MPRAARRAKTPRHWTFVDAFPVTGSGKVRKYVLRDRWDEGEYTPEPAPARG